MIYEGEGEDASEVELFGYNCEDGGYHGYLRDDLDVPLPSGAQTKADGPYDAPTGDFMEVGCEVHVSCECAHINDDITTEYCVLGSFEGGYIGWIVMSGPCTVTDPEEAEDEEEPDDEVEQCDDDCGLMSAGIPD